MNYMEDKDIHKAIANTFTEAPLYEMEVPVRVQQKRSLWKRLTKAGRNREEVRKLVFYESYVGNQIRIAGEAALLPDEIFIDQSMNIVLIPEHQNRIAYIVAAALQNDDKEPDPALIKFIKDNLKGGQLREALIASFQTLNMEAFTDTIVLMKGTVNILTPEQTSPKDGSELIASHTAQLAAYASILVGGKEM